uniref:Thioredoxin domain-containing protein n=1 Tax=Neobodo designis TaxID=312471 RepID=A0A7S1Q0E8_NEODS|mmetsp:Transcript_28211/g.87430  ORF Transcript_28211/g.87430 Transcript_28211/m.87430 type:complete len:586 (+) Transcript_28211:41-1798(+)
MLGGTRALCVLVACAALLCAVGARDAGANFIPSRVTVERKTSLKGKTQAARAVEQKARVQAEVDADLVEHKRRIAERIAAMEAEPDLSEEDRARWLQEIEREKAEFEAGRAKKGHDPLYAIKKRKDEYRMDHDEVHAEAPKVHPPEKVAPLHEIHESRTVHSYFDGSHRGFHATLLVEANCEHCADAIATFEEVTARIADTEYHLAREARTHRFAVLNVTAAPQHRTHMEELWHLAHPALMHYPVVVFVNEGIQEVPPHFLEYRPNHFESDLDAALRRISGAKNFVFRDEDEFMHCAFEHQHDGVAFAFFIDRTEKEKHFRLISMTKATFQEISQNAPLCLYTTSAIGYEGNLSVTRGKLADDVRIEVDDKSIAFLDRVNPDRAHMGAFFIDEENHDDVTAEYFTFDAALLNTLKPPRAVAIRELQRFRRWYERALGRRHTSSGRRFRHVDRRQTYTTHGDSYCHDNATDGDVVTATVRAESVDHKHVFYEAAEPTEFVVGEPISGLPPWLHTIFNGACAGSRREVYSPPREGFAAELVHVVVSAIKKPVPKAPEERVYTGTDVPVEVHTPADADVHTVTDDDDL